MFFFTGALLACGQKGQQTAEGSETGYNPQISPLPERTPKPLEEWGIDNGETIISHTFSAFSDPMYPPGATHFDYVNPNALQGGTLRIAAYGIFDNLNPYKKKRYRTYFDERFDDSLMRESYDEVETYYPLIAEKIEYAKDFSYVIFHIDPRARFPDGQPILAKDVVFSFTKFIGLRPEFTGFFAVRAVRVQDMRSVRFDLAEPDRAMIAALAELPILLPQFWEGRNLLEPLKEVPLGSGAWKIADYEIGAWILFEKRDDYWAADLLVNRGLDNFRYYRTNYYQDTRARPEALRAGELDFVVSRVARLWATEYSGPLFESGAIIKAQFANPQPKSVQGTIFNIQNPLFADYRVRRAISYAFDFEWRNKNMSYHSFQRLRSYFPGTIYEAKELPSKEELAILEPIRQQIPPEVFTSVYEPPDGSGQIRKGIASALALLKQAGWELKDGVLQKSGKPFVFEIMIYGPVEEQMVLPMQQNLKKMGITMNFSMTDTPEQYKKRLENHEYDMINYFYGPNLYPAADLLRPLWYSELEDSSDNVGQVNDAAIDYLIDGISANQQDKQALIHWGRALDRVIQWQSYIIFHWTVSEYRVAHINKFGKPDVWPKYGDITGAWRAWWLEPEKLLALPPDLR